MFRFPGIVHGNILDDFRRCYFSVCKPDMRFRIVAGGKVYLDCALVIERDSAFVVIKAPVGVVKRKSDGAVFVLDTKWKLIDSGKANYGIAQADMYRMFAYQKKYGAEHITLLYPETEKVPIDRPLAFKSKDGVTVQVQCIDLFDAANSIAKVARQFEN